MEGFCDLRTKFTPLYYMQTACQFVCVDAMFLFPGWFLFSETTSISPQAVPFAVPSLKSLSLSSTLCLKQTAAAPVERVQEVIPTQLGGRLQQ